MKRDGLCLLVTLVAGCGPDVSMPPRPQPPAKPAAPVLKPLSVYRSRLPPTRPDPGLRRETELAAMHAALEKYGPVPDIILALERIVDPSSVPFLIDALARQGDLPTTGPIGVVDTRAHTLDALRQIANREGGVNAADWRAWYDANKRKPPQQWVREGFAAAGLPVSDPATDAFVAALVRAANPDTPPRYIQHNAVRALKRLPHAHVRRVAASVAQSPDVADRRGAIEALDQIGAADSIGILRPLARDADVSVAGNALRVVNNARHLSVATLDIAWDVPVGAGAHVLAALDDRTIAISMGGDGGARVAGFDLVTRAVTWNYTTGDSVESNVVRLGNCLCFVTHDRVLHCIGMDGHPLWRRQLSNRRGDGGLGLAAANARLFVAEGSSFDVFDPSGGVRRFDLGRGTVPHVAVARARVFGATSAGELVVVDAGVPPRIFDNGLRVSTFDADGDALCAVTRGHAEFVVCVDQDALKERWRTPLPDANGSAYDILVRDGVVYLTTRDRRLGFDAATGRRLWATTEFSNDSYVRPAGRVFLTEGSALVPEWRDVRTGEALAVCPDDRESRSEPLLVNGGVVMLVLDAGGRGSDEERLQMLTIPDLVRRLMAAPPKSRVTSGGPESR